MRNLTVAERKNARVLTIARRVDKWVRDADGKVSLDGEREGVKRIFGAHPIFVAAALTDKALRMEGEARLPDDKLHEMLMKIHHALNPAPQFRARATVSEEQLVLDFAWAGHGEGQ